MQPLISVIVPVYKVEAYLTACVESVLAQTYENFELILVDDGSPDNCPRMCDEFAARDSRIRVIHKENGGLSSARNAGIDAARGAYLAFLWLPVSPEKLATVAIAIVLLRLIFPKDEKTLLVLAAMSRKARSALRNRKKKPKE